MVQTLIVILIVAAAVVFTVRKVARTAKGKEGCGCGCKDCAAKDCSKKR